MKVYGVFAGDRYGATSNRAAAELKARELRGVLTVYDDPDCTPDTKYDSPTLRALSTVIADYRLREVSA